MTPPRKEATTSRTPTSAQTTPTYTPTQTIDYQTTAGHVVRAQPGDLISDMSAETVATFLGLGLIEPESKED